VRKFIGRLMVVLALAGWAGPSLASIITFDEPGVPVGGVPVGNVIIIDGVSFAESIVLDSNNIGSGHPEMSTSQYNVMYVRGPQGANYINLVSGGVFDFYGAAFACACAEYNASGHYIRAGTDVEISGYLDSVLIDQFLLPMSFLTAEFQTANLTGIDQLQISVSQLPQGWSRDGWFTMDDFTYQEASVPTPATLALFTIGLAGLGWPRRKKV
jgi:hypothetical protein